MSGKSRYTFPAAALLLVAAALFTESVAFAEITSAKFVASHEVNLSGAGTRDWAVFGPGAGKASPTLAATDSKTGGRGIRRTVTTTGGVRSITGDIFGKISLRWWDGTRQKIGRFDNGQPGAVCGMSLTLGKDAAVGFTFDAPGKDQTAMASVSLRQDKPFRITARQGAQTVPVVGAATGWIQIVYSGTEPLTVEITNPDPAPATLRGFATTLSPPGNWWLRDGKFALLYLPPSQDALLQRSQAKPAPDYLQIARRYADCMLQYGRDRYGKTHSPLFSNILTREKAPQTTPYPRFAEISIEAMRENQKRVDEKRLRGEGVNAYARFDYDHILNYPEGLGTEGPHKVTLYGCDIFEDRALYNTLFDLTRITGRPVYKQAAEVAIVWWFRNTQGPSGLYPWGEHAGWDLVYDCPVYFAGPSEGFFEANYHEVRDYVPFLEYLVALPATKPGEQTPLEKYALGIWNQHFWDKEKAWYNRHGDYTGKYDQRGENGAFPAHLGFYLRVWTAAYLSTRSPEVKKTLDNVLNKVADMAVSRTEKYGFFPFSLDPELKGADPGKEVPGQSLRLAYHAADVATQLAAANPGVAAKLGRFAALHLKTQPEAVTRRHLLLARQTGDVGYLQGEEDRGRTTPAVVPDLSGEVQSDRHAAGILNFLRLYRETGDRKYLETADSIARLAYETFCDDKSPLPRAFGIGAPLPARTVRGEPFPDFYFQGAKLMHAFALLGEAQQKAPLPPNMPRNAGSASGR